MLVGLLIISEYIFLDPYVIGYISPGSEIGFGLIVVLSGCSALVISLNVYRITIFNKSKGKIGTSVFSSFIGTIAGACSCGPIGLTFVSTFGTFGATASAFLTTFEIPIRIAAIVLLLFSLYATIKSLKVECNVSH